MQVQYGRTIIYRVIVQCAALVMYIKIMAAIETLICIRKNEFYLAN